jgi:hypothetical protein
VGSWLEDPEVGVGRVVEVYPDRYFVRFPTVTRVYLPAQVLAPGFPPANWQPSPDRTAPRTGTPKPDPAATRPSPPRAGRAASPGQTRPGAQQRRTQPAAPVTRAAAAKSPPKAGLAKPTPAPRARPSAPWLPVPPELLRDLRADGYFVERLSAYYAVRVSASEPHNLLRLRVTADGGWEATPAGNSGFGRTDAYKAAAPLVERQILKALRSTSKSGSTSEIRAALRGGRKQLLKAAQKYAPPPKRKPPPRRKPRPGHYTFVQGGAPGLGKRA